MELIIACTALAAIAALIAVAAAIFERPLLVPCIAVGVALAAAVAGALLTLHQLNEPPTATYTVMEART